MNIKMGYCVRELPAGRVTVSEIWRKSADISKSVGVYHY